MARPLGECGHPVSKAGIKKCRECWLQRGPDGTINTGGQCLLCHRPLDIHSRCKRKGVCRSCYDNNRSQAVDVIQGQERAVAPHTIQTYEDAVSAWHHWIGMVRDRYRGPAKPSGSTTQRVVIAGDFHAPFHDPETVAAMFDREAGSDLLIISGDLMDFYSVSRFTKYQYIPIQTEIAAVTALLEQASERFAQVVVVEGNHDQPRFERHLRNLLSLEMVQVVELLTGGVLSPIEVIAKKYPNVSLVKRKVDGVAVRWFHQEGDLLVTHAEKFSRVPGATLRGVDEYMDDFTEVYGLQPWSVIAQAHTHQLGWFPWRAKRLLVETGCMCQTHGYQLVAKISGRPQRRGWVTLEQTNGVTDLSSVRPLWFDALRKSA